MCLITSHFPLFPQNPQKLCKEIGDVSPCKFPMTAFEREETPTHLCFARTQSLLPSPFWGAVGLLSHGLASPLAMLETPGPPWALSRAGCQGGRQAALAIAAELPALNNGAIEGLELGVRPGWPRCGLRTGRTAEPACSTPAELQPKIGTWWPFRGWASLSGGHGLFACGDFVEYLWLGEGEGRREPGSCVTLFLFVFWC